MSRSLTIRKPLTQEVRQLNSGLDDLGRSQRRRDEAVLLYEAGLNAVDIAQALGAHPNTIYTDLHAFHRQGLDCLQQLHSGGASAQFSPDQIDRILRLVERAPYELGLPYGRWSLSKLSDYLIQRRVVKTISREHLRRILGKGGSTYAALSARSSVTTPNG